MPRLLPKYVTSPVLGAEKRQAAANAAIMSSADNEGDILAGLRAARAHLDQTIGMMEQERGGDFVGKRYPHAVDCSITANAVAYRSQNKGGTVPRPASVAAAPAAVK